MVRLGQGLSPLMLTGKKVMVLGRLVWTVSFLLVLFSSPMLVFDLIGIQRSVEVASGADIWYDGQVSVDLLRLQAAVRNIEQDPPAEVLEEVRLRLDNAYNRINSLPEPGSSAWHTQGLGREDGLMAVRQRRPRGTLISRRSGPAVLGAVRVCFGIPARRCGGALEFRAFAVFSAGDAWQQFGYLSRRPLTNTSTSNWRSGPNEVIR